MKRIAGIALMAMALAGCAMAPSPYAGEEARGIKALSAAEVDALATGKGMGLAKAAELNGYPGPAHVLELSADLGLTESQRKETQALFAAMQAKAVTLGQALLDEERALDRLFAEKKATPELLAASLARIGELQAKVRGAHLEAHLAQAKILTGAQSARYAQLRGYAAGAGHIH